MGIQTGTRKTTKVIYSVTEVAAWVGYAATIAIVLLVFIDVFGRYFLKAPLRGSLELVEQTMVLSGGFAIIYCTAKRGHVVVDVLFGRFSKRLQKIMISVFSLVGFGISIVLAYNIYLYTMRQMEPYPRVTDILRIITSPFQFGLAIAIALGSLVFLVQAFEVWVKNPAKEKEYATEKEMNSSES